MVVYEPGNIESAQCWQEWAKGEKTYRWLLRTNTGANFIIYSGSEGFIRVASPCCGLDIGITDFARDKDGDLAAQFACDNCSQSVKIFDDAVTPRVNLIPGSQLSSDGAYVGDWPLLEFFIYFIEYFAPPLDALALASELEALALDILKENFSLYGVAGKKDTALAFTLGEVR